METKMIVISGSIVYDFNAKAYKFKDFLLEDDFSNGMFQTEYSNYLFVRSYTFEVPAPLGLDLVAKQIEILDEKEKRVTNEFNRAMGVLRVERNNLLAIENSPGESDEA